MCASAAFACLVSLSRKLPVPLVCPVRRGLEYGARRAPLGGPQLGAAGLGLALGAHQQRLAGAIPARARLRSADLRCSEGLGLRIYKLNHQQRLARAIPARARLRSADLQCSKQGLRLK